MTELSTDVDENNDRVFFDGKLVQYTSNYIYLMLYKPKGCITSLSDDKGRKTVMDFIPEKYRPYVKPVGRLDYDSEGLLLFTNDGDFAKEITSPASKIKKHYIVKIEGTITRAEVLKLSRGVALDENTTTAPAMIKVLEENNEKFDLKLFASKKSRGKKLMVNEKSYIVHTLDEDSIKNVDYALFFTPSFVSNIYIPPM